ncbi:hypothetical protein Agub_g5 [Astrephomene gubernaculifera]|uniref:GATA-type domain-containing protein n=1 Tax=Astrephomene gubernaculifera TaxID=47775 RepID=A0AAD3DDP8_9CHLO|nr:hypothetical protein Agub_g5 [Astrephomene gubernaculifera]
MAAIEHMPMFDDGDALLFGGVDLFDSAVPCIAGELELQLQSYEGAGDLPIVDSSPGKSFSLTKDSGGSSICALAVADFADPDFIDNVSLDDLAAADHYGHTICGRQSTAESVAAPGSSRSLPTALSWNAVGLQPACLVAAPAPDGELSGHGHASQYQYNHCQESSDCDMSHTVNDGESSGVGPGKGNAQGSSQSEASEDNTAGVAPDAATAGEEHISMPSFGLSLSRLAGGAAQSKQEGAYPTAQEQLEGAAQQPFQHQQQQAPAMPRAYSVDNFAMAGPSAAACPDSLLESQRCTAHVPRSYSCVAPDSIDLALGCGGAGNPSAFGSRGRCASLNETQMRRQWLCEGELLAPQLPPSVNELELLELPEDTMPVRPARISLQHSSSSGLGSSTLGSGSGGAQSMVSGLAPFKGSSGVSGSSAPSGPAPAPTVTVKRKIITSPSPLLPQPRQPKSRQSVSAAGTASGPNVQSPKRVKVIAGGYSAWQEAGAAPASSAGVLSGWNASRAGPGVVTAAGTSNMKTVRSMPANMNSFLDGSEQPLGAPGAADSVISPNGSTMSSSTLQQTALARGSFFDPAGAGRAAGGAANAPAAAGQAPVTTKRSRAPGAILGAGAVPGAFMPAFGQDGKRLTVPGVPKPRKRASPNGNPPKAPAPNPNGHCCTQCGTQTTPVWRAGPHGPKTLCNACGVRYMKVAKGNVAPAPRRQQQH